MLDSGQDRIHPLSTDLSHPLRSATSLVIELVTDTLIYPQNEPNYDSPMLIMTYGAILSLAILRDPFTQLDRDGLIRFLRTCQKDDGGSVPSFPTRRSTDKFPPIVQFCTIPRERRKGSTDDLLRIFNLCDAWGLECD